jgi:chemotaxis protein CheD
MDKIVKVGMADLNVIRHPGILMTLGLGSCVGIALYDTSIRVIGLAHIMLPSSQQIKNNSNDAKFADTAIDKLIKDMCVLGAKKESIVAKIAGGSQMFAFNDLPDSMRIGTKNIIYTKDKLKQLNIPVIGEDTGGNHGRTIKFYSDDGKLLIETIGHGTKYI